MTGKLTEEEIENVLQSQSIGRLACCYKKIPYLLPITYFYDGNSIYAQTFEGLKLSIMRKNPFVCFQVDIINSMKNWKSVIVNGNFVELKGEVAEKARDTLYERVFILKSGPSVHYFEHERGKEIEDENRVKPILFRIHITTVSGRFEKF